MPRIITNEKVVALAEAGKAVYQDGGKPKPIETCGDSFVAMKQAMTDLMGRLEKSDQCLEDGNTSILATCDIIIESMTLYHEAIMTAVARNPQADSGKLDEINANLLALLKHEEEDKDKPKEWSFVVERDMMGEITSVNAKEVED